MHTKTLLLAALLAVGLMGGTANAMNTDHRPPPTHDGHSDPCVVLCTPLGGEPGNPDTPAGQNAAFKGCGDKLGHLGRVTAQQIGAVRDERTVHLVPLCDMVNHSLTQDQAASLARGNIQGLVAAIAGNGVIAAKLGSKGYDANDVVGVAVGSNAAVLYVSRH